MQRIQGKPTIKKTNQCQMQRGFRINEANEETNEAKKRQFFLCIIKAREETLERKRRSRGSRKSKSLDSRLSNIVAQDLPRNDKKDEVGAQQGCGP